MKITLNGQTFDFGSPILDPKNVPEGWVTDIFGIVHPPTGQTWVRSFMGDVEYFTDWTPMMKRALATADTCEATGLPREDCALCQWVAVGTKDTGGS